MPTRTTQSSKQRARKSSGRKTQVAQRNLSFVRLTASPLITRICHEMTAIRKILQGRESIEVEELKRLQGRGNIEGGTF